MGGMVAGVCCIGAAVAEATICGREVVRGFRLYVSPIAIEFDGDGSNTSAEVDLELGVFESNLEGSKL